MGSKIKAQLFKIQNALVPHFIVNIVVNDVMVMGTYFLVFR